MSPAGQGESATSVPIYGYEVVQAYPHQPACTQGLVYRDGILWESTGLYGASTLRTVDLNSGHVLQKVHVPPDCFAEGMTILEDRVYQLTWREQRGFMYHAATLEQCGEFAYTGEGWGLTNDGQNLIRSDGSNRLRVLDSVDFTEQRTMAVCHGGQALHGLNDLQYVDGEIYANVWPRDVIIRVDAETGRLTGVIDLRGLLPGADRGPDSDVLNGIAQASNSGHLLVTGKLWPKLFEIRLVARQERVPE